MVTRGVSIALLDGASHDRTGFDCGVHQLNSYLHDCAIDDAGNDISKTYVATPKADNRVLGFCTLAATSVRRSKLDETIREQLGRFPQVPGIIMGQLGVQESYHRQGIGGSLLTHMFRLAESLSAQIGIALVILDALNEEVKRFYEHYGFRDLPGSPLQMFISMREIRKFVTKLAPCQ